MANTYIFDKNNPYWDDDRMYNHFFLMAKMNYFNDLLRYYGFIPRYEVLRELGFDTSIEDLKYGWVLDGSGDDFIDFGISNQTPKNRGRKRTKYKLQFNCVKFE